MRRVSEYRDLAYSMFSESAQRGLLYATAEDDELDGRTVQVKGRACLNFGSCSYLGLEMDARLKQGVVDAVMRYGTQFSASRAAMSSPAYGELEAMFERLFGLPALIAPTTTLGHLSALPILIDEDDAVILDQQAHNSLHMATNLVKKAHVELVRHNRIDQLEARVQALKGKHRHIWYLADGVYSMLGDYAPLDQLAALLSDHEQLHLYIDDAHGMSWAGRHGRGTVLGRMPLHPRMVVATSLAKAFAVGGGVLLIPDPELRRKVQVVGGPMVFSGPIQPPMLGAALASARIHLSDEIDQLQQALQTRIALFNRLLVERDLPVISPVDTPIRFVGTGLPRVAYNLGSRLLDEGYFFVIAHFPVVPMKHSGLRFTVTLHHTEDDIYALVDALARHLPLAFAEEGGSLVDVRKAFRLGAPAQAAPEPKEPTALHLQHATSIMALDPAEWDRLLGTRGSFTWSGLRFLESTFRDQPEPENNWRFHYYVVRDAAGRPVLATFFTEAIWKDDMIAPPAVSRQIEQRRREEPGYLTSPVLGMGSLLTEGEHLYLDRTADWRGAMGLLLEALTEAQERAGAVSIALRDLAGEDPEMDAFMRTQGFARFTMPESYTLTLEGADEAAYLARLSPGSRRHLRKAVMPWDDAYQARVFGRGGDRPSPAELDHFYHLYKQVKDRGMLINTFDLPKDLFARMLDYPEWELLALYLKRDHGGEPDGLPVGVLASFVGPEQFVPMVIGLDYRYVRTHGLYRQFLRRAVRSAAAHGVQRVHFGMGAGLEKERFGAVARPQALYFQSADHFHMEVVGQMMTDARGLAGLD